MVLIFAAEDGYSIEKVCRYLEQYQCDHLVIYETDVLQDMDVHFEGDGLIVCLQFERGKIVYFADIEAFWFYNGFFKNFRIRPSYPDSFADWGFYIQSEGSHLADFIHKLLANKPSLNNFHNELYTNKLYNLHMAAATGLCIPETWIVQSKEKLARLFSDRDSAYI